MTKGPTHRSPDDDLTGAGEGRPKADVSGPVPRDTRLLPERVLRRNAGLDFLSFAPKPEVPRDYFNEIPVSINIKGPYHSVGFFFDQVANLDRIVSVSGVIMGKPEEVQGEMLLDSKCQLVTYRFTNVKLETEEEKQAKKKANKKAKKKK